MPPIEDEGQSLDDLAGLLSGKPGEDQEEHEEAGADEGGQGDAETGAEDGSADEGDGTPNEGTDDQDAEANEGDGEEEDDATEGDPEPFYTVKIDGKEERVTLKEALDGYQRNKDYTRKTQEVAEVRKALDAETAGARQQRTEYVNILKVLNERLGAADQERTEADWNALRASDPTKYATEWTDFQRRTEQRNAIKAEQTRVETEQRAEDTNKFKAYLTGERTKLQAALPILKDPVKGPEEIKAIRKFASDTFGYSEAELDKAYDHRILLIVNMARQWDNHSKALAAARTKVKRAPDLPEPGPRTPLVNRKARAKAEQMKTLERTGKIDDAVALMFN